MIRGGNKESERESYCSPGVLTGQTSSKTFRASFMSFFVSGSDLQVLPVSLDFDLFLQYLVSWCRSLPLFRHGAIVNVTI